MRTNILKIKILQNSLIRACLLCLLFSAIIAASLYFLINSPA